MTKKLSTVLIVILTLLVCLSLVLAADKAPFRGKPEIFVKPTLADRQVATPMPRRTLSEKQSAASIYPDRGIKDAAATASLSGSGTEIQAAPFEHPKDFCDLYGVPAYYITNWLYGLEWYANYQDPAEHGCTDVWPFEVVDVGFDLNIDFAYDIDVQGFVYSADLTDPACPVPGTELCQTPVYTVSIPSAGWWSISLPFQEQCCVYEPYFSVIYIYTDLYGLGVDPISEEDPTDVCRSYNDYGYGWEDLVVIYTWPGEMLLWSTGYTNPQNTCEPPLEECHLQYDNGSAALYFGSWGVNDENANYFDPATVCTACSLVYPINITSVEGLFYDFASVGAVDVIWHFYEAGDPCAGPGAEIYSFASTITTFYPDVAVVPTPEDVCLEDDFFLSVEYASGTAGSIPCILMTDEAQDTCVGWIWFESQGYSPPWWEYSDFWSNPTGYFMIRANGICADLVCYPGEECDMTQGSGVPQSYFGSWNVQDKVAKYYDPEEFCTPPVYPYRISEVEVALYDHAGVGSTDINVRIYIECQQPCDGPGTEIYSSGPTTVDTFYPSLTLIDLPDLVCIYEPFFIAIEYAGGVTGEIPSVLFDDGSVPMDTCHAWVWYDGYSPPWWEWSDFWAPPSPGTPMIYVSGYTQSPACDIPACDTTLEWFPGGGYASYYWRQPPNDSLINMRFEMPADHGGRLERLQVGWYQGGTSGTPDPEMYVWLSDGTFPLDNNAPHQALAEFHATFEDIVWYPGYTQFGAYQYNLIFDPGEKFHIGGGHAFEPGDELAWLSDDGYNPTDRASGWYQGAWESYYPYGFRIEAYICPIPWQSTFIMQCAPALGYATPGDPPANVYQVELTPILGYAENVTLSLLSVDPPAAINATFTPNGVPPPCTSDVAITADVGVPYGDYTLTFQGVGDDGQTKTCDVTLRVQPPYEEVMVDFFHGSQRTSNFGAIGNDARDNFVWYGTDYLFDATFISAVNVDPVAEHMALDIFDCDHLGFVPSQHLVKTYDPWCPGSPYEEYYGEVAYSNFYTTVFSGEYDSLFVIGLKDVDCSDFSIKINIYHNPTPDPIPELWIGLFEDWDIGDAYDNWVEMDPDHNLAWIYDVADSSIVFGILKAPLTDDPMHVIRGVNNAYYIWPYIGFWPCLFLDSLWYLMTTAGYYPPVDINSDSNDMSLLMVPPPFSLNPGEKHTEIWIDFGRNLNDGLTWEQWWHKILRYVGFYRGDVNASDTLELPALDVSDLIYLINYLYKGGPPPQPFPDQGDVDGQPIPKDIECPKNNVNAGDVVYLLNYVWKGGPPPVDYVRFIPQYWSRPSLFTNPNW